MRNDGFTRETEARRRSSFARCSKAPNTNTAQPRGYGSPRGLRGLRSRRIVGVFVDLELNGIQLNFTIFINDLEKRMCQKFTKLSIFM